LVPIPEPNLISFLDPFSTTKAHFPKWGRQPFIYWLYFWSY
jgi:hypothetical protein